MIILKIIGIILVGLLLFLAGLLLLVFLLSLISVGVILHYDSTEENNAFTIKLKYAFLKFTLYPEKIKKEKNEKNRNSKNEGTISAEELENAYDNVSSPGENISAEDAVPEDSTLTTSIVEDEKPIQEPAYLKKKPWWKRTEKKEAKDSKAKDSKSKEKKSLREQIDLGLMLLRSSKKALNTVRKHFIVDKLEAVLKISGSDAHEAAVNYGKIQILVTNLLALVMEFFHIRVKHIQLDPNFLSEQSSYKVDVRFRIRPVWAIKAGIHLLFVFLRFRRLEKQESKKETQKHKGGNHHE